MSIRRPTDPIYDPLAAGVIADPYSRYRRLREADPVYWHAQLESWVCTGFAEVTEVLSDTDSFGSDFRRVGEAMPDGTLSVQSLDPPEHSSIRRLLVAAMHRHSHFDAEGRARHTTRTLLRRHAAQRRGCDLVHDVARPVALSTICGFLGVDLPGGEHFEQLSNEIVRSMDGGLEPERVQPGIAAREELSRLADSWLTTVRDTGYLAALQEEQRNFPQVPSAVVANSVRAVLHAGYESVSRLLGLSLARLTVTPGLMTDVRDPSKLGALVEEMARLDGPVQADARVCVADARLGVHEVRRGELLVLLLAAANRDPAVFARPDQVDLARPTSRHLAFGRGAHACLGSALGRATLRGVLQEIVADGWALTAVGPGTFDQTATLRGYASFAVNLKQRALRCAPEAEATVETHVGRSTRQRHS